MRVMAWEALLELSGLGVRILVRDVIVTSADASSTGFQTVARLSRVSCWMLFGGEVRSLLIAPTLAVCILLVSTDSGLVKISRIILV